MLSSLDFFAAAVAETSTLIHTNELRLGVETNEDRVNKTGRDLGLGT